MLKTPETNLNRVHEKLNQFLVEASKVPPGVIRRDDPVLYNAITLLSKSLYRHGMVRAAAKGTTELLNTVESSPKYRQFQASLMRIGSGKLTAKERENELCRVIGQIPEVVREQTEASLAVAVKAINHHATVVGNNIRRGHYAGTSESNQRIRPTEEREILDMVRDKYVKAKETNPKPSVNGICKTVLRDLTDSPFETVDQLRNAFEYDKKNYYCID